MKYYLVDFENIKVDSLELLEGIEEGDQVVFFCTSKTTKNMPTTFLLDSSKKNIQLSFFEVATGKKNAMDFQLATYLGYIIGKSTESDRFFVVSKDKGYSSICDFWNERSVEVKQIGVDADKKAEKELKVESQASNKTAKNTKKKETAKKKLTQVETAKASATVVESGESDDGLQARIEAAVGKITPDKLKKLTAAVRDSKTKLELNEKLTKLYSSTKKGGEIYQKVKQFV